MCRYLSLAVLGIAGLATAPAVSQAQTPVGVGVQVGPVGVAVGPGYTYVPPPYVAPAPVVVTAPVVVARPYVYPWFWDGYRWVRRDGWTRYYPYNHHYYHHHR
jgi:hypothetical protein